MLTILSMAEARYLPVTLQARGHKEISLGDPKPDIPSSEEPSLMRQQSKTQMRSKEHINGFPEPLSGTFQWNKLKIHISRIITSKRYYVWCVSSCCQFTIPADTEQHTDSLECKCSIHSLLCFDSKLKKMSDSSTARRSRVITSCSLKLSHQHVVLHRQRAVNEQSFLNSSLFILGWWGCKTMMFQSALMFL